MEESESSPTISAERIGLLSDSFLFRHLLSSPFVPLFDGVGRCGDVKSLFFSLILSVFMQMRKSIR